MILAKRDSTLRNVLSPAQRLVERCWEDNKEGAICVQFINDNKGGKLFLKYFPTPVWLEWGAVILQ